jgi:hypothetical protein
VGAVLSLATLAIVAWGLRGAHARGTLGVTTLDSSSRIPAGRRPDAGTASPAA